MTSLSMAVIISTLQSRTIPVVRKEFASLLSTEVESKIRTAFSNKTTDDDINISSDQVENLTTAIAKGLAYPALTEPGKVDYQQLVLFLEKLCDIFKWEKYEKSTLGHISVKSGQHGKLRWYAVILAQWISGNGLSIIMQSAVNYKKDHPSSGVEVDRIIVDYDDSIKHRNIVISDTLNAIEDVILFRIANYFLRFSSEYKRFHKIDVIDNDWYEYVEYGTMNPLTIFLQRNGFSREASTYVIISKVNRGAPIPCPHFEKRIIPLKKKAIYISKRESIRHIEETVHPSFRKERHQSFRKDRAISFQNDSFASD